MKIPKTAIAMRPAGLQENVVGKETHEVFFHGCFNLKLNKGAKRKHCSATENTAMKLISFPYLGTVNPVMTDCHDCSRRAVVSN